MKRYISIVCIFSILILAECFYYHTKLTENIIYIAFSIIAFSIMFGISKCFFRKIDHTDILRSFFSGMRVGVIEAIIGWNVWYGSLHQNTYVKLNFIYSLLLLTSKRVFALAFFAGIAAAIWLIICKIASAFHTPTTAPKVPTKKNGDGHN